MGKDDGLGGTLHINSQNEPLISPSSYSSHPPLKVEGGIRDSRKSKPLNHSNNFRATEHKKYIVELTKETLA
jgi:hypothetical protein